MPFDEENDLPEQEQKVGLKKVSTQKSIFDSMPKKPTPAEFQEKVKHAEDKNTGYKRQAAELSISFKKIIADKTLTQNKNVFMNELEQEVLSKLVKLASTINEDDNEQESMGSLMIIILLLKTSLYQRDRLNKLEYLVSQLEKKMDPATLKSIISQEINGELDKKKNSE